METCSVSTPIVIHLWFAHISQGVGLFSSALRHAGRVGQGKNDGPIVEGCHGSDHLFCESTRNSSCTWRNREGSSSFHMLSFSFLQLRIWKFLSTECKIQSTYYMDISATSKKQNNKFLLHAFQNSASLFCAVIYMLCFCTLYLFVACVVPIIQQFG